MTDPTPTRINRTPALSRRLLVAALLLLAAAGGVYAGARWHSSITPLLGMNVAHGDHAADANAEGGAHQLWTCGMHPQVIQDHPGDCPICHMKLTPMKMDTPAPGAPPGAADHARAESGTGERKIKYWWDPMLDPPYISDKPGKSPMGMDLIPVYEDEAPGTAQTMSSAAGTITIDPAIVQNMGVRTAHVIEGPLERSVRVVGYLAEAEPNIRDINLRVSGWVRRLYANTEGMRVEAGDPLFDLYSPELQVAIEELISSRRARGTMPAIGAAGVPGTAATLMDAASRKLEFLGLDPRQIEALARLDRAPATVTFNSPITGYVTEKPIVEGAAVSAGQRALRIVDQSVLWLEGHVFEKDMPFVTAGQEATARIAGGPTGNGDAVKGEVIFIRPRIDPMTRTTTVRLAIPNPSLALRPGMYATVRLQSHFADRALLVPREAVIDTGERQVAFVAHAGGRFEPRQVTTGVSADGGLVQIIGGLSPGDVVVTSGQFLIDSESRLREAIQKFLTEKTRAAAASTALPTTEPAPRTPAIREPTAALGPERAEKVDAIVSAYLDLSAALGAAQKDTTPVDPSGLIAAAHSLHAKLRGAKEEPLAAGVAQTSDAMKGQPLDKQRELFKPLSANTIALADALPPSRVVWGDSLVVAHCPMAPGDWLQRGEDVANPYYANEMKQCGNVVRSLRTRGAK